MKKKNKTEFKDHYAISIDKFLSLCSEQATIKTKRIKHKEIRIFPLVIPVSMHFAIRYENLLTNGTLVIVRDDFGKYQCYICPKTVIEIQNKGILLTELSELQALEAVNKNQEEMLINALAALDEKIRIVEHFGGANDIEYSSNMCDKLAGIRRKEKDNLEKTKKK